MGGILPPEPMGCLCVCEFSLTRDSSYLMDKTVGPPRSLVFDDLMTSLTI